MKLAFMGSLGMPELLMLLVIVLVFFGARKIPALAKGFGQGIKEFKEAIKPSNLDSDKDKDATKSD